MLAGVEQERPYLARGPWASLPPVAAARDARELSPFVGVQVFGRCVPEALLDFADFAGRLDIARRLQAGYDTRIAALRAEPDRLGATPVSQTCSGPPECLT